MDNNGEATQLVPTPPSRLFERLDQLSGYTWDLSVSPIHSSYDHWHVFGTCKQREAPSVAPSVSSTRSSPQLGLNSRPPLRHQDTITNNTATELSTERSDNEGTYISVVARVSTHVLRLEREHHICKSLIQTSDPACAHTIRPVELIILPSQQGDNGPLVASVFESPGPNYLRELIDFGPAFMDHRHLKSRQYDDGSDEGPRFSRELPISVFLDFAIGASECLELLHHGLSVVHGEIRADTFHFNRETGAVKLVNFGSGTRSFENGLTSAGWSVLSKELGVETKLQFIAPEQTGRMPAEPDSRTDIYSLGILFWTMLTQTLPFEGGSPLDIIQNVLNRRILPVASKRFNVPDVISRVIRKMTQKQIDERYHSVSGLKHDLVQLRQYLMTGETEGLENFRIGTRDVSSFFHLPTAMFAREKEKKVIVEIVEKVAKRQSAKISRENGTILYILGSTSSTSGDRPQSIEDGSSDTSSPPGTESRGGNHTEQEPRFLENAHRIRAGSSGSMDHRENFKSPGGLLRNSMDVRIPSHSISNSQDGQQIIESSESLNNSPNSNGNSNNNSKHTRFAVSGHMNGDSSHDSSSASIQRENSNAQRRHHSQKFRRRGQCEVISIIGAAGLGKSSLIQNVQGELRQLGYFASGKFDNARKAPFEPVLRVMGSLFRQIFSESNLSSEYHKNLRSSVKGIWPSLCKMLDLPYNLISVSSESQQAQFASSGSISQDRIDNTPSHKSSHVDKQSPSRANAPSVAPSTKSLLFMNTFLEVLRILTTSKLICLCLDDLQFADDESIDLISSIIAGKLRIVLLVTCRQEEELPAKIRKVLKSGKAHVTNLQLSPLTEEEVIEYVAATLYRPAKYVFPLAAVCMEKTSGNPFYLRQMLEVCYRKNCLWYSWKDSQWEYDLDRIFTEFESEIHGQQLNTRFITKRLQDQLPPAARSILAWASLLGSTFSFGCVQKLLGGEFDYPDDDTDVNQETCPTRAELFAPVENAVQGLQACLQAYILVPGEVEDQFRFSHDRFLQGASLLRECHNVEKMHFMIAKTMMKYYDEAYSLYTKAEHICRAVGLVKTRIHSRKPFRKLLREAGKKAVDSGAFSGSLYFYESCLELLQLDPWKDDAPDVDYEETLEVYTKLAELYWIQGQASKALNLLKITFSKARTTSDKAPAWILQSRLYAQRGDASAAFNALKACLEELGMKIRQKTTWQMCDEEYKRLQTRLESMDMEELTQTALCTDPRVSAIGAVIVEAMGAAFWGESLLFYQMAIEMIRLFLEKGAYVQIGLGFCHFTMTGLTRFGNVSFGRVTYAIGLRFLKRFNESSTTGRGLAISSLFIVHLLSPIRDHLAVLEEAVDHSLLAGDKIMFLVAVAGLALSRLWLGSDMADTEAFCSYAPEEFGNWAPDLRGGVMLISVRQVARALQGKTQSSSAKTVMSDKDHDSEKYMQLMAKNGAQIDRPRAMYNSMMMIPLYLFGYYNEAINLGKDLVIIADGLWSMRTNRLVYFYYSLSLLAKHRDGLHAISSSDTTRLLAKVAEYKEKIESWQVECDVNYAMWSQLIEAECCEIRDDLNGAIQSYEAAADHTQDHGFALEEALVFELQGGFYLRRGAKRAARAVLEEAIGSYSRIHATAKADQLRVQYDKVLKIRSQSSKVDIAIQTATSVGAIENTQFNIEENQQQNVRNLGKETSGDRTKAWLTPSKTMAYKNEKPEVLSDGLDVLDLQSILEFNHAISSELHIDRLLVKMTETVLECAGAEFAGVAIEDENGTMCMAASGTQDGIFTDATPLTDIGSEGIKQVVFYTLRFKETVFVQNILGDERFTPNSPQPKAVIAIPILQGDHLLGALYLEGQAGSFTAQTLGVLQLFRSQASISITNALLFRRVRKVSATNTSLIESLKRSLTAAQEAENKAKVAEAEAMRNVREKEEAARAKSMFLANVSHELRTPLNGVIGCSELLQGTSLNQEQNGYVSSIRVCADTLLTVINDILDFSKLEAGKMQLFSVPLNLHETITEVVRALQFTNTERELQTEVDLDLDKNLLVVGDSIRLHQIFMNLLSNAYKFTNPGGTVTVGSRVEYEDDKIIKVHCWVADTGIGITQEQLGRLFKPFSQADSSTQRSYGGSGLGLSICKALVSVLGGKIWLESQIGVGTTCSFELTFPKVAKGFDSSEVNPIVRASDPMATWSSDDPQLSPLLPKKGLFDLAKIPRDQLRICIAEDNPINQKIAVTFVSKLGFKSTAYNDGKAALDGIRKNAKENTPFQLVLMDIQMPILDGISASRLIREDEDPLVNSVIIIALTASAIKGDAELCIQAGMNNYLAKPIRIGVLKTMLENYLSQPPREIPNLEEKTKKFTERIIQEADGTE